MNKSEKQFPFLFPAQSRLAAVFALLVAGSPVAFGAGGQGSNPFGMPVSQKSAGVASEIPIIAQAKEELRAATAKNASGAQVVQFTYDSSRTYTIPIRDGSFTTLRFDPKNTVQQVAVSNKDALAAVVNESSNTVMMQLTSAVTVSATVVTTEGVYYLTIVPSFRGEPWYQGVSWGEHSDTFDVYSATGQAADGVFAGGYSGMPGAASGGAPNFDYVIDGDGSDFAPVAVWDNGEFTWVQFRRNLQQLPALFVRGPNGLAVVNYTVHADGTQILVNRLMPAFELRIGESRVVVEARR